MSTRFTDQMSLAAWLALEITDLKKRQKEEQTSFRAGVIKVYVALVSQAHQFETMIDVSGSEILDTKIRELVQFVNTYKPNPTKSEHDPRPLS